LTSIIICLIILYDANKQTWATKEADSGKFVEKAIFGGDWIEGHNGKSPLELAGVNTTGINWIKFSQKNQH